MVLRIASVALGALGDLVLALFLADEELGSAAAHGFVKRHLPGVTGCKHLVDAAPVVRSDR